MVNDHLTAATVRGLRRPRAGMRSPVTKEPPPPGRMLSGRRLDLLASPLDVEIADIAHGLARVARWNGQTSGPQVFSVAQHSLLVERIGLHLHPGCTGRGAGTAAARCAGIRGGGHHLPAQGGDRGRLRGVETRLLGAVRQRFGLPAPTPALTRLVKQADRIAAHVEAVRLAGFSEEEAARYFGPAPALPKR